MPAMLPAQEQRAPVAVPLQETGAVGANGTGGPDPESVSPQKLIAQLPDCDGVPNGSEEVLLIPIPVSKPAALVTYGNIRTVRQALMFASAVVLPVSLNRGIGSEPEAAPP